MASGPAFRHNQAMSKALTFGLLAVLLGLGSEVPCVLAKGGQDDSARVLVRGRGHAGSIVGRDARLASVERAHIVVRAEGRSGTVSRRPVPRSHRAVARGGVIHRDDLEAILNEGIGRFLQQVSVTAVLERGRFVGWRLLELRPRADRDWTDALTPGDIVVRMNGHSLERPGDFKRAWESMRGARSLQFDIRREGKRVKLLYPID